MLHINYPRFLLCARLLSALLLYAIDVDLSAGHQAQMAGQEIYHIIAFADDAYANSALAIQEIEHLLREKTADEIAGDAYSINSLLGSALWHNRPYIAHALMEQGAFLIGPINEADSSIFIDKRWPIFVDLFEHGMPCTGPAGLLTGTMHVLDGATLLQRAVLAGDTQALHDLHDQKSQQYYEPEEIAQALRLAVGQGNMHIVVKILCYIIDIDQSKTLQQQEVYLKTLINMLNRMPLFIKRNGGHDMLPAPYPQIYAHLQSFVPRYVKSLWHNVIIGLGQATREPFPYDSIVSILNYAYPYLSTDVIEMILT